MVIIHQDIKRQDWMTDDLYRWALQEEEARCNSLLRQALGLNKALVCIKAQDPLCEDGTPNAEYTARLREALRVKADLESRNFHVTLMTFGGIHEGNTKVALAGAGTTWLTEHGVSPSTIITDPTAFSGFDEDEFGIREFERDLNYAEHHIICSSGQVPRTYLFCVAKGYQPTLHPITHRDTKPRHSMVCEVWGTWAGSLNTFRSGTPESMIAAAKAIRQRHLEAARKEAATS